MILIGVLFEYFIENIDEKFPNHVIHVRKQDVSNIKAIIFFHINNGANLTSSSTIDLSKLVQLSNL